MERNKKKPQDIAHRPTPPLYTADLGAQRVATNYVIMKCKYVNCCRSEHLFPSAVSVARNDLVSTDENYNYTLVMAARNGVTDVIVIPGRRHCV